MEAGVVGSEWVGRVIDGRFTLLEWLGGSDGSGVFRTEQDGPGSEKAAIRVTPKERDEGPEGVNLDHPHLTTILNAGVAEVDGSEFVYAVTDYADEVLSQILPQRALTPEETREMLGPVVDALDFLHQQGLVHGHLNPSSILVIHEELKLSATRIVLPSRYKFESAPRGIHDAPDLALGIVSPAADVWSLGVMLVETLTQQPPRWDRGKDGNPEIPASVPQPFAEIVRRCLQAEPVRRCTMVDIKALLEGRSVPLSSQSSPGPVASKAVTAPPAADKPVAAGGMGTTAQPKVAYPRRRVLPMAVALLGLAAVILFVEMRARGPKPNETTRQSEPAPQGALSGGPAPGTSGEIARKTVKGSVHQRVMPNVQPEARSTIRGTLKVVLRLTVDASGQVANVAFESAGPSRYFARVAEEAAHSWKFRPPEVNGRAVSSVWKVRFDFRSSGDEASAEEEKP